MTALSVSLDQARTVLKECEAAGPLDSHADDIRETPSFWLGRVRSALAGLVEAVGEAQQDALEAWERQ